jgi:hypothetical protein
MMKRILVVMASILVAASANAADVGVSVSVGQPGFYGRIDIGNLPAPQIIYPEPVVVVPAPAGVVRQPIYLHVPPGHAKNWRKHCKTYKACGRPVYFVREDWYDNVYVPESRARRGGHDRDRGSDHERGRGHGRDKDRGHGHGRDRDKG